MNTYNTSERNIQIVLYLLKQHGIKRVIASPGSTDVAIVASMQHDPYFEMFSAIDERSACYMACGMATETKEPVVIVCTGATSSRNYMPGLTEAYYRHLPVLAITCSRSNAFVGHYVNQVTDRSDPPKDTVNESVYIQSIYRPEDEWDCTVKVNKAILGLSFNGGGPCHINLETVYKRDFTEKEIKPVKVINRYTLNSEMPEIPSGKIGIFVGSFPKWSEELTSTVDSFCKAYNAVVFYDQTSNYKGKYGVLFPLITSQPSYGSDLDIDLMIYIGYVSAGVCKGKKMWRVNPDGQIRDPFRCIYAVFQMAEIDFFQYYVENIDKSTENDAVLHLEYKKTYEDLYNSIPEELPFSNIWVAKKLAPQLPDNSVLHLGICNSLRSWNFFNIPDSVNSYSNTGGFGIDGGISSMIGASLVSPDKLYFGVFGDLLFYYDMNSIGNRDINSNVRIIIINNGLGQEFKNYSSFGAIFGEDTDKFIAARGHFGNRETPLIKNYAECLGFEYKSASSKEEIESVSEWFTSPVIGEKPSLLEVFTETESESKALDILSTLSVKSALLKSAHDLISSPKLASIRKVAKKIIK